MKIALVSDLHANLQAWRAVLLDIRSMRLDVIICLGDTVGYGPNPAEVVASLAAHANHCLLGNHDAALVGKIQTSSFTPEAGRLIAWTRGRVGKSATRYLSNLPLTVAAGDFRCAHGDFSQPAFYHYIHQPEDARASWEAVPEPLLFVGHTHRPAIAVRRADGESRMLPAQDFALESGHRYLVNVGSVGQPRDGDARACYCIYDQDQKAVFWRRLPFDLDAFRAALRQAGVPESASPFLNDDPLASAGPPEDQGGFHPPTDPAQAAQGAVEVLAVDLLRRRVRAWKIAAFALLALALALGLGLADYWRRHTDRSLRVAGSVLTPLDAALWPRESNLLALADAPTLPNESLPGWSLHLGDGRRQSARAAVFEEGEAGLVLESRAPAAELRLVSREILVEPGTRVAIQAMVRKEPGCDGTFALLLLGSPETPGGGEPRSETLAVKPPNEPRQGGWFLARQSLDLPARIRTVRVVIQGSFSGTARVKDIRFVRRR